MKINGNDITVQRGESFTIDFSFTNKDGSPFVISSEIDNLYIKIAIASNTFNTLNQYSYNQWCELKNFYKFVSTNAYELPTTDWSTATLPAWATSIGVIEINNTNVYYCKDTIFSVTDTSGNTTYRLFIFDENPADNNNYSGNFVDYQLRLVVGYDSEITKNWTSQNYTYSINLVETEAVVQDGEDDPTEVTSVPLLPNGQITVLNNVGGLN